MSEVSPTEIANQAIASAVTWAVQDDPGIQAGALDLIAIKVATAVAKGFAAFSASGEQPTLGS